MLLLAIMKVGRHLVDPRSSIIAGREFVCLFFTIGICGFHSNTYFISVGTSEMDFMRTF